ncbi:MAG: PqqD family protein [Lentisphaerae bacterium]|nr:PqqD family protein [Lentisphaerota bacterium]
MQFAPHIKWRREKFGAVVFDTLNEKIYVTNATGGDILNLLAQGLDAAAITTRLKQEFTGDPAQIEAHANAFLRGMQAAGFLAANSAGST